MRPIRSAVDPQSERFKANHAAMQVLLDELEGWMKQSRFQGAEKHVQRARAAGQLLARERIELLLDRDAPFLELCPLAGMGGDGFGPGGTSVGGVGLVHGRLVMIIANVGTNKGGAIDHATLQKALRLNEIALENALPVINLVASAGANLPDQARIFNYGGINFREITRRSAAGIPTISIVFGNSTAGGAYIPGMSDYTIMVKEQAKMFLAGPPLVRMATGEVTDEESLGGADMHSRKSGVSDYIAADEYEAIRIAREIVSRFKPAHVQEKPRTEIKPPLYSPEELTGVLSPDLKQPFDVREVIARIVDGSAFHEFKPDYGGTLVTGFAEIHGYRVGILGNNGVLFSESANKGTHFIQLCNQNDTPILFLQNTTGFMVGKEYEEGGIIKHGAHLINAVANSTVPSITLMIGASYGAGNYAMNGRAYEPRFLFSYPHARIAVMGPEQLAGVMSIIQAAAAKKAGKAIDKEKAALLRKALVDKVDQESSAAYSSGQLWDDGIIDPAQTRNYLGFCLAIVNNAPYEGTKAYGIFRM